MSLPGNAALAMWWDMAPEMRAEFEDWHSHEHFPERLAIPGFRRSSRWTSATGGEGIFVMYELDGYEVLSSPGYLSSLNAPSPWSTKMMPHHRNMVRCQSRVLESRGGAVARQALTVRLSPAPGRDEQLRTSLRTLVGSLPLRPGLTGAHLLRHEAPPIAQTTEQKIRGGDQVADWVLVALGYDAAALDALAEAALSPQSLVDLGAAQGAISGMYSLSYSAIPADMQ
ncbi:hypothetical protein QTI66_35085 [Variovorax sp. J22R133]|uniref:hypothetical protein n=1 Tax=Variovorax brevis TaxID=3053503 RepID=UPI002578B6E7|nr:hypothetical protein [Variovorax sp. J22R133]MDM0117344.1 hypothetical protein [Variovorax sp. J22R133]